MMSMTEDHGMDMSNASTTTDPSVVQSRILQSASLAKESDTTMDKDAIEEQPTFPQLSAMAARGGKTEYRRVRCPPHRYTPLRENWEQILTPLVEFLKLQASHSYDCDVRRISLQRRKLADRTSAQSCSQSRFMQTNPLGSLYVAKKKRRDVCRSLMHTYLVHS